MDTTRSVRRTAHPPVVAAVTAAGAALLVLAGCSGGGGKAAGPASLPPAASTPADTSSTAAVGGGSDGASPSATGSSASPSPSPSPSPSASPSPSPSPSASPTPAPTGGGTCASAALRASLGQGQGAAGSTYQPLVLTNTSSLACTLSGFPGVSFVTGDAGRQVGPAARRGGAAGTSVRLAPGAAASAQLQRTNTQVYDPASCKPVGVRGLRVYPPGQTAALFAALPADAQACSAGSQTQLTIQALQPGAAG